MKHKIATIINYCSNDYPFITHTINQAKIFSNQIIVPYCDHFYDGTTENQLLITKTIKKNPQVKFVNFPYNSKTTKNIWRGWQFILRQLTHTKVFGPQYWICYARLLGTKHLNPNIKFVLFLDADEVIDGNRFKSWLDTQQYLKLNALKPANFWYWRSPQYQATTYEDSALLAKKSYLNKAVFLDHDERNATFNSIPNPKQRIVMGLDKKPMIHHYGWAKPKQNLLKKVQTWGHSKDRNWTKLVKKEYKQPFSGTDFIYHRKYKTVKPFIKI
jgi:hypothetical protein